MYRCLVGDLLTNTLSDDIPFTSFRFEHILNRPGSFEASIPTRHSKATRTNIDPGKTALWVERDGVLVWGGICWTARAGTGDQGTLTVGAEGFWSHLRKIEIRARKTYSQVDQLAIARDLVTYGQSKDDTNIGIQVGTETSGVLRDRTWEAWEHKNLAEAVEQLSAVENGFDFAVDVEWQGNTPAKVLRLGYPTRGRRTDLVFSDQKNIQLLEQSLDATVMSRNVTALGAGEGRSMLRRTAVDATLAGQYPAWEQSNAYKDVSIAATLEAHAQADLAAARQPKETITVRVIDQRDLTVGSWITGDEVTVRADDGWVSVDGRYRITTWGVAVNENGEEEITLGFADTEAFV